VFDEWGATEEMPVNDPIADGPAHTVRDFRAAAAVQQNVNYAWCRRTVPNG